MTRYKVGVVGCGFFGSALARELAAHPRFELTMLCDRDLGRAKEVASEFSAIPTDDHDAVAAAPLDLVVVATPNHAHAEPAIAALERGKAVFVEKPLAVELVDARNMIASADANGSSLMVGHIMRMMPGVRRLAESVRSGELGDVSAIETSRSRWIDSDGADPNWWKLDKSRTGGELTHEIHELDLLCWLGGDVSAVSSIATADDGFRNTVVKFVSGAVGRHAISTRSHTSTWDLTVNGSEGAIRADFHSGQVRRLRGGQVVESWPIFDIETENQSLIDSAVKTQKYNSGGGASSVWMQAAIRYEIDEIAAVLDTGSADSPLLEASDRALVVAEQVRLGNVEPAGLRTAP
ncbi:Gfo/Idh/MocA family oxidoreductase [Rhodococcus sp. IEGM 1379]|uniref:Gfo/Idh/MocA family protein n=1 Tax=Rhodococcus sp. IEGM 1379 TaxID=3047086 RepID=UPI0024B7EE09|nr:Gfo/Idh/MocA family oxidoreductase [Rhodococcus sp. IEGM 1379]MDI9915989.1 Gfo/Idh/MocA family oxidoreductase [Rhodococcus sp. IEGM 1379]